MGNRGGRLHDGQQTLGKARWKSKQWICCALNFKNRQREVWGAGYTEFFFLDEATALASSLRQSLALSGQVSVPLSAPLSMPLLGAALPA